MVLGRERQSILTPWGDFHFPRQFNRLSLHAYALLGAWLALRCPRAVQGLQNRFSLRSRRGPCSLVSVFLELAALLRRDGRRKLGVGVVRMFYFLLTGHSGCFLLEASAARGSGDPT
jgi:hypothetical protein